MELIFSSSRLMRSPFPHCIQSRCEREGNILNELVDGAFICFVCAKTTYAGLSLDYPNLITELRIEEAERRLRELPSLLCSCGHRRESVEYVKNCLKSTAQTYSQGIENLPLFLWIYEQGAASCEFHGNGINQRSTAVVYLGAKLMGKRLAAKEVIEKNPEKNTLKSLQDLYHHLGDILCNSPSFIFSESFMQAAFMHFFFNTPFIKSFPPSELTQAIKFAKWLMGKHGVKEGVGDYGPKMRDVLAMTLYSLNTDSRNPLPLTFQRIAEECDAQPCRAKFLLLLMSNVSYHFFIKINELSDPNTHSQSELSCSNIPLP